MAEKIIRTLIDDIDGSDATRSRTFTIDGKTYRIDLSDKNNDRFDKAMAPFLQHATRVRATATAAPAKPGRKARSTSATSARGYDLAELRAWAKRKRIKVPARGRIPAATVRRFLDENGE